MELVLKDFAQLKLPLLRVHIVIIIMYNHREHFVTLQEFFRYSYSVWAEDLKI